MMGFFPDVQTGEKFKPNALLSNNVRHIINTLDGTKGGAQKGIRSTAVRIQVFCNTALKAGTAVSFTGKKRCGDAICVEPYTDPSAQWGVIPEDLPAGVAGDCIIEGPVEVELAGDAGRYATPNPESPGQFICRASGAPILFKKGTKSVIHVGPITPEYYNGPFAITYDPKLKKIVVTAGYACKAGNFVMVNAAELDPVAGTICVVWENQPEIKFETPGALHYPIGVCEMVQNGNSEIILVSCCRVSVAMFDGDSYDGPFGATYDATRDKIVIAGGYASRNGEFVRVSGRELEPRSGTICVTCELSGGTWTTPAITYASPSAKAFPIATSNVRQNSTGKIVGVNSCRMPVAVFIVTAECPVAAKAEENSDE